MVGEFNYKAPDYIADEVIHYFLEFETGVLVKYSDDSTAEPDFYNITHITSR